MTSTALYLLTGIAAGLAAAELPDRTGHHAPPAALAVVEPDPGHRLTAPPVADPARPGPAALGAPPRSTLCVVCWL